MSILPIVLAVTTAAAFAICRAALPHARAGDLLLAAGISLLSGELGMWVGVRGRHVVPAQVFQSLWLGSAVHLLLSLALGAATVLALKLGTGFVLWLLLMYWVSLLTLSVVFIRVMRSSAGGASLETR